MTDHNGCVATTTGDISEPSAVSASSSNTAILCHGGSSTVTVSATGGTGAYSGTGTFSVPAGTYSYTVTDHNGCVSTTTGDITQPSSVVASSSNTDILCHGGNSIVTVSATGGTGAYSGTGSNSIVTVSATGGTGAYSGTGTFSVPAGTYSYTVTDANSCTSTTTGDITQPSAVTADSSNSAILCNGGNSTVTVTAGGGTGPYTGDGTFSHAAGTYSYTVTDHNGCTSTTTGTITQPNALLASSSNTAILCNGGSSTVTVSATGGTAPYNGTGTASRSAGTYSYTVTDANGCMSTTTGSITQPDVLSASSSNTAILCNGGSSTVTVNASGGTAPYNGTGTFSHAAGTYSYTVTDANSCTATTTGSIRQPTALTLGLVAGCNAAHSGSITATFGGGTGTYQCKLDNGSFGACTSPTTFNNVSAGLHSVTVKDAYDCPKSGSITVDPCVGFCSLTMGAYGNPGGVFTSPDSCYSGLGTLALIQALLGDTSIRNCGLPNPDPLIVGIVGTRSLTIPLSAAQCIITRLPANGTPDTLPNQFGDQTLNSPNCLATGTHPLLLKNGKFVNVLLGQTITLGLNLRLDPTLADLDLTTIGTPGGTGRGAYREFCTTSGGRIRISQAVIDATLNSTYVPDPTHRGKVSGLLDLANRELAGLSTGSVKPSDVNAVVDAINRAFDECGELVTCPL